MYQLLKIILCLIFCFNICNIYAQKNDKYYLIHTKTGSKFKGKILEKDDKKTVFLSEGIGKITINNDDIQLIRSIKRKPEWNSKALQTKNFWMPTAVGARPNESYYQNIGGLFNQINLGITNNFSFGFGMVPLFFGFQQSWPIWGIAKYSLPIKKENLHFAVGVLGGHMFTSETDPTIAVGFGLMTMGNEKSNFTIGLAYGKYDGNVKDYPITALSGSFHIVGPLSITTENFFFVNDQNEFYSYSLVGGKFDWVAIQLDMGIVMPRNTGHPFFAFPLVGISLPIGRGKG